MNMGFTLVIYPKDPIGMSFQKGILYLQSYSGDVIWTINPTIFREGVMGFLGLDSLWKVQGGILLVLN